MNQRTPINQSEIPEISENVENYETMSFEEAMAALETVVSRLDSGEGTLDESIELFQKGIILSRLCSARLDEIEKKVRILTDDKSGARKEIDFAETNTVAGEKE